jgi:hypothetical protein
MRGEAVYHSEPWYRAYLSALFESNAALIGARILLAERLIAARELELVNSHMPSAELRALNRALLALRALALCRKATAPSGENASRPLRHQPDAPRSNPSS